MAEEKNKIIEEFRDEGLILKELHEDERKIHEDERKIKVAFFGIGALFVIVIIVGIFYLIIQSAKSQKSVDIASQLTPTPLSSPTSKLTETPTPTPIVIVKEVVKNTSVKEQFIPFGSGSNQTSDWADVPGLQASIDFGSYGNIKDARFEISVNIPTANETASVRLFNVTDKHPVWYSEVTTTNNVYTVSPPIIYDKGVKTYQVQMKTQLQFLANLTLARIHIILQ